jgi:hypothetical protein
MWERTKTNDSLESMPAVKRKPGYLSYLHFQHWGFLRDRDGEGALLPFSQQVYTVLYVFKRRSDQLLSYFR